MWCISLLRARSRTSEVLLLIYGEILCVDVANGVGCRTSLFVSGCTHHCTGCFQPETWDFLYGKPYTKSVEDYIVSTVEKPYVSGLTLLGGEPMEPSNQEALLPLIRRVHALRGKTIWVYSGYTWEELVDKDNTRCRCGCTDEILHSIDVLVDGEFHIDEKNISLRFRGSGNQRIIDVPASIKDGVPVMTEYMRKKSSRCSR